MRIFVLFFTALVLAGCARYNPHFSEQAAYIGRAVVQEQRDVKVSVTGLSAKESNETFGVDLARRKILPLWIRIENKSPETDYFFAQRSVSEQYYSSGEAAYMSRIRPGVRLFETVLPTWMSLIGWLFAPLDYLFVNPANNQITGEFNKRVFPEGFVKKGETKTGFVFVPAELGYKEVNIDLLADSRASGKEIKNEFDFMIEIPGMKQDYQEKDITAMFKPEEMIDVADAPALKKALEALPDCVTNRRGNKKGDPVNLVMIATPEELITALKAAKWDETEIVYFSSLWKMFTSFSFKKKYRYSPVSPLYLYGRSHDAAFQKARDTIHERMHLRLWYSPIRFQGKSVWVGSISRDIGVRWTLKTWNLMTHKIDPDIDESLVYLMADLFYSGRLLKFDTVKGVPPSTHEKPRRNLTGDVYYTEGIRLVTELSVSRSRKFPDRFWGKPDEDSKAA